MPPTVNDQHRGASSVSITVCSVDIVGSLQQGKMVSVTKTVFGRHFYFLLIILKKGEKRCTRFCTRWRPCWALSGCAGRFSAFGVSAAKSMASIESREVNQSGHRAPVLDGVSANSTTSAACKRL
jgi:hypothetical protein